MVIVLSHGGSTVSYRGRLEKPTNPSMCQTAVPLIQKVIEIICVYLVLFRLATGQIILKANQGFGQPVGDMSKSRTGDNQNATNAVN